MDVVFLSIGTSYDNCLDVSSNNLREHVHDLTVRCYDSSNLNKDPHLNSEFLETVKECNLVVVKSHSDVNIYKGFDTLIVTLVKIKTSMILECNQQSITNSYRNMFYGSDKDYALLITLIKIGGEKNWSSVLKWYLNNIRGFDFKINDPYIPPAQGIYISREEQADLSRLGEFIDNSKPNILLLFHQKQFNNHDVGWVDDFVSVIKNKGANPIPVFLITYEDQSIGSIGIKRFVDEYLIEDGQSIIDCVIETMSFSQRIMSRMQQNGLNGDDDFFSRLNVPVLKVLLSDQTLDEWKKDPLGIPIAQMPSNLNASELDGQIIELPCAITESSDNRQKEHVSMIERMERISDRALAWVNLQKKPNELKKVAILLYMYPPRMDLAGGAFGLDSMESISDILKALKRNGYDVGDQSPSGRELCDMLLERTTNNIECMSDERAIDSSAGIVSASAYSDILKGIPKKSSEMMCKNWGEPPGKVMTIGDRILVPGMVFGNVFVGFQPDRGKSTAEAYHDAYTSMPHQYLAFYRWLKNDFDADAIIHVGTHGTVEWLPGKSVYLSDECYPDIVMDSLPNIYPYIVDNPGEGIQSKRRSAAVIVTHMIPPMMRSVMYDDLSDLERLVSLYMKAESNQAKDECDVLFSQIMELLTKNNLSDLISNDPQAQQIDRIHDYLLDLKDNLVYDGLHVLGRVPEGKRLDEMIYSITKVDSDFSLRTAVCRYVSANDVDEDPDDLTEEIIRIMHKHGFVLPTSLDDISSKFNDEKIIGACKYVCTDIIPKISAIGNEIDSIIKALNGRYVAPSPSGCPTRGSIDMLPTGRNFYSLDPDEIPWKSSWAIGVKHADQMIEKHIEETGSYPNDIGIVLWDVETIRTGGEDIAYILWLMGLRPTWTKEGHVTGLDVVPVAELGRPRLDVTIRASGLFRDTFPNLLELLDEGVRMVMGLDEREEDNRLRANMQSEALEVMEEGVPRDQAIDQASKRIFSTAPGQYGGGVIAAIVKSGWNGIDDLASLFLDYGCYAYGKGKFGQKSKEEFIKRISKMKVTVKNHTTREMDMFDMDDEYDFLGGMNAAVKSLTGNKPSSYMGDSSNPNNLKTRTAEDEARYIFRSKICNPEWISGLKKFDYSGAQQLSKTLEYVFAWDATSDIIDDWMFESMAREFVLDKDTNNWLKKCNPYALKAMTERLLEAYERKLWSADENTIEELRAEYLETEEFLEEKNEHL